MAARKPTSRKTPDLPEGIPWPDLTVEWFNRLKENPGTRAWTPDEWDFAIETATVHAQMWSGDTAVTTALRKRLDRIKATLPKPPTRPWTSRDTKELLALYRQGMNLSQIATLMERGKAQINRMATSLDLSFDRSTTKAATLAQIADARAAKVQVELAELEILQEAQKRHLRVLRGEEKWKTVIRGEGGETVIEWDFVPPRDERDMAAARQSMSITVKAMADATSGADTARTRSLLADMANKFWPGAMDGGNEMEFASPADGLPLDDAGSPMMPPEPGV